MSFHTIGRGYVDFFTVALVGFSEVVWPHMSASHKEATTTSWQTLRQGAVTMGSHTMAGHPAQAHDAKPSQS